MKSYWDHSEQERSVLTQDQFDALTKLELMEAGVVVPATPAYEDITDVKIPKKDVYQIAIGPYGHERVGILFEEAGQAEAVAVLLRDGVTLDHDHKTDTDSVIPVEEIKVGTKQVARKRDIMKVHDTLTENKARKERNNRLKSEYSKMHTERRETLSKMSDDWYENQQILAKCKKMQTVWEDYLKTCEGQEVTAIRFFQKAYDTEDIETMNEWLGLHLPIIKTPEEAEDAQD